MNVNLSLKEKLIGVGIAFLLVGSLLVWGAVHFMNAASVNHQSPTKIGNEPPASAGTVTFDENTKEDQAFRSRTIYRKA